MSVTDYLLLGWTIAALSVLGVNAVTELRGYHDRMCWHASYADKQAKQTLDPHEIRDFAWMAEEYRRSALWSCE